ncbi:hypothetical protein G9464_15170 [Halostella sp. JP-L12]|uniref:hypothetical protein n=1 Tax=Halostella TaxID=1843185 RepID=UPI000EF7C4B6|nr:MULTISPECIES: hypothetical protein [Halostella]NHN48927.1 hypothetical protein [Halostella sp. JP-L12]
MTPLSRRTALRIGGASLAAAVAGCLGRSDESDPADGSTSPDDTTDASNGDGSLDVEIKQYDGVDGTPRWYDETSAQLVVIDSEERARAALGAPVGSDATGEFVSATDFAESVLLFVAAAAPNACYGRIDVSDVRADGGRLVGSAAAVDESDGETACAEVVSFPAALVRVTFDGDPVTGASLSVTDGWGETADLDATADDSLGPDPEDLAGHVRPDGDPERVPPALDCDDDEFRRHIQPFDEEDLQWGEATGDDGDPRFAMRVDRTAVDRGGEVRVTLTNVADEVLTVGNSDKHSLQVYTDAGWQDVRGATGDHPFAYTDEAYELPPGEGFEWNLSMTKDSVVADHQIDLTVCPGLPAGRYRFVFWNPTVAVAFDLRE